MVLATQETAEQLLGHAPLTYDGRRWAGDHSHDDTLVIVTADGYSILFALSGTGENLVATPVISATTLKVRES